MVIIVLLIYTAIYVPYKVCFVDKSTDLQFAFDLIVDFLFMSDIVISFFTVLEDENGGVI